MSDLSYHPKPAPTLCDLVTTTRDRLNSALDRTFRDPEACEEAWARYVAACQVAGVRIPGLHWSAWPKSLGAAGKPVKRGTAAA